MPVVVDLRQRIEGVRDMLAPSLGGTVDFIMRCRGRYLAG